MVPTLAGRIQTRLVLLAVVGGVVTAIIVPVLPVPASASLGDTYRNAFLILAAVLVLRFVRTGGIPMLRMMGGSPDATAEHDHTHHAGHDPHTEQEPTPPTDDPASHDHGRHHP